METLHKLNGSKGLPGLKRDFSVCLFSGNDPKLDSFQFMNLA
jgi:hypothetical protein